MVLKLGSYEIHRALVGGEKEDKADDFWSGVYIPLFAPENLTLK